MKKHLTLCLGIALQCLAITGFSANPAGHAVRYHLPAKATAKDYLAKTVVFKLTPDLRSKAGLNGIDDASLNAAFTGIGAQSVTKLFPHAAAPTQEKNKIGLKYADLTLIYVVKYNSALTVEQAVNSILAAGHVLYAEPKFVHRASFIPNDLVTTGGSSQYAIKKIKCDSAWDVNTTTARGDTNVVIGIVDTGTDTDHPDLVGKIKYNYADPVNGIDDDLDGYIDNYTGWDMADSDNNTLVAATGGPAHGSHVSGCAASATNNGVGVASPGFNCKFLPVKASQNADANAYLVAGYEGITYAADHGCQIINCSWGGGFFSSMGQDVINYATINKDALVFAAAGNDGLLLDSYPAAYNYVISVGSTTSTDTKSSFSNYGYTVDLCAPGSSIRSTYFNNTYSSLSGTSMASPTAAGAGAIVKSFYGSTYNALQVGEKLRVTCDNIDALNSATYRGLMGTGRVNLYHALINASKSVRMINMSYTDNNDNGFVIGDTVRVLGDLINYLDATTSLSATITTASTSVTIVNPTINAGAISTLGTYNTNASPFSFKINPTAADNEVIVFKITFTDGSYTDIQYFSVVVNVDFINITVNDVFTTNTSKGSTCWNDQSNTQGLGFSYHDSSMVYEAGLMIGTAVNVSDNDRGATAGTNDVDFTKTAAIRKDYPSTISDFDLSGSFNDNGAGATKLNVSVNHRSFAWVAAPYRKFVIYRYVIKNNNTTMMDGLYAGMFADWDVTDATYITNRASFDATNRVGYVYNPNTNMHGGTKLLTHDAVHAYAIDNIAGGAGGVDVSAGFTAAQKFQVLSTDRFNDGTGGAGEDMMNVVSSGPFTLFGGDSVVVAFAMLAGDDLADLQASAGNAQIKYDGAFPNDAAASAVTTVSLAQNTLCIGEAVDVSFTVSSGFSASNTFTAILSDATGSFAGAVTTIGTANAVTGSGVVHCTIPAAATAGTGYRILVKGYNPAYTVGPDNGTALTLEACVAGIEDANLTSLSVYPNPSNGSFELKGITVQNANVKVTDITGRVVLNESKNLPAMLDLSAQAKGVYMVEVSKGSQKQMIRLMVK